MRRAALFLIIPLLLALGPSQFKKSVKLLTDETGRGYCTTFSINQKEGYWLTAGHCLNEQMFIEGKEAKAVKVDLQRDLAVLQSSHKAPALPKAPTTPNEGDEVVMLGYPSGLGEQLAAFWGHIMHVRSNIGEPALKMVYHEGGGPGMSGGPIVDRKGRVVGVLQGGATLPSTVIFGSTWSDTVYVARDYWK